MALVVDVEQLTAARGAQEQAVEQGERIAEPAVEEVAQPQRVVADEFRGRGGLDLGDLDDGSLLGSAGAGAL